MYLDHSRNGVRTLHRIWSSGIESNEMKVMGNDPTRNRVSEKSARIQIVKM